MGNKLNNAHVYCTVAQIQFNPILNLDGYIPAIQPRMREIGFPDYRRLVIQQFVLPFSGTGMSPLAQPTLTSQPRYLFGDIEERSLFLLDTNTLTYQTTAYETFESFAETLLKVLGILHDILQLAFVEMVGLRLLDAIQPNGPNESLRDYLVPEVLGLSLISEGGLQYSTSETVRTTAAGQLVTRVLIQHGRVSLPLDLANAPTPVIPNRFTKWDGLHAVIDTDASMSQREVFDLAKVQTRLVSFHDEIDRSFKATVTANALASWA